MPLSKSKTTKKETGTKTETGTTTPVLPGNLQTGLGGLVDRTNQLAAQDPYSTVAGVSPLQQQSWNNAANLGSWTTGIDRAGQMVDQATNSQPNFAGAYGYNAPQIAAPEFGGVTAAQMPQLGGPATMTAQGYQAPQLGGPAGYTAQTTGSPQIGDVASYDVTGYTPMHATAQQAGYTGYTPTLGGPAAQATAGQGAASFGTASLGTAAQGVAAQGEAALSSAQYGGAQQAGYQGYNAAMNGPVGQAEAGQAQSVDASGLISKFYNPYQQQVIDSALADADQQAMKARQAQLAQAAGAGAFGGSRFGVATSQLEGELTRARNSLDANIRSDGFKTALGAAQTQAGQDTGVNVSNAANRTQTSIFNIGQENENSWRNTDALNREREFYANAGNTASITNANNGTQASLTNAELATRNSIANADRLTSMSNSNADRLTSMSNSNADRLTSTSNSNARNLTDTSNSNADRATTTSNSNAELGTRTSIANTESVNQNNWRNNAAVNDAAQFAANAYNLNQNSNAELGTRVALQNTTADNDAQSRFADALNARGNQYAGAINSRNISQAQLDSSTGQFNAGAINQQLRDAGQWENDFAKSNADYQARALQDNYAALNRAGEINANAANDFAKAQFGEDSAAARQFAGDTNQANIQRYSTDSQRMAEQARLIGQASEFGAKALNDQSQFNANQIDDQMSRYLTGAGIYGDLANSYASNLRGDIGLQSQLGDQQRQIQQQYLNAPTDYLTKLAQIYGAGNPMIGQSTTGNMNYSSNSVTKESPNWGLQIMQNIQDAAKAAMAASDRRAKRDIVRVGQTDHGLGLYRYNYHWDAPDRAPRTGVMADEVARIAPQALGPIKDGYRTVDYGALGLAQLVED